MNTLKRNLFDEVMEGMEAMKLHRQGTIVLKSIEREIPSDLPSILPNTIVEIREKLKISPAIFAQYLNVSKKTLDNWEKGKTYPNSQAVLLLLLVKDYPDMLERIAYSVRHVQ